MKLMLDSYSIKMNKHDLFYDKNLTNLTHK